VDESQRINNDENAKAIQINKLMLVVCVWLALKMCLGFLVEIRKIADFSTEDTVTYDVCNKCCSRHAGFLGFYHADMKMDAGDCAAKQC
jgi:hypothetical protein